MPNRILKESICTSDDINQLTAFEETVFYRLMVNCDDYGRMDARISLLKSRLFPIKDVREDQVQKAINALSLLGMVSVYTVDHKPYLQLTGWDRHQTIRAKRSKFPSPDNNAMQVNAHENICKHMQANVPVIQSESVSESQSEVESEARAPATTTTQESHTFASAQDAAVYRENMGKIEQLAKRISLPFAPIDYDRAETYLADYGIDWVLEAMTRTSSRAEKSRSWGYVEAILKSWRKKGGMDQADTPGFQHIGKRVEAQNYTQRQYGEIDLTKLANKMITEAQKEPAANEGH